MPDQTRVVSPAFPYEMVRLEDGTKVKPPEDWALLKPGDPGLTRRVRAAGPCWTVQSKKGRKVFTGGVWAPASTIDRERAALERERLTPAYQAKMAKAAARRDAAQDVYVREFQASIVAFLAFAPVHEALARRLSAVVSAHATPVGSGTVARTKRIPVAQRAEAAVIAWMRHQTTSYDHLRIARVKGRRREVRAELARESRRLLAAYRNGEASPPDCPLVKALQAPATSAGGTSALFAPRKARSV